MSTRSASPRSESARVGRHGNLVVCTPAKPKASFNAQSTSGKRVARLCADGMTRIWDAAGHLISVFSAQVVVAEMAQLPAVSFYRAR